MKVLRALVVVFAVLAVPAAWAQSAAPSTERPARLPASVFARGAQLLDLTLSPRGDRLLALKPIGAKVKVVVIDLAGGKSIGVPLPEDWDFVEYEWAGDQRVLIRLGRTMPFGLGEAFVTRLVLLDLPTESTHMLGDQDLGPRGGDILYVDPKGEWMLAAMQTTVFDYPSVYRIDLATRQRHLVERSIDSVWDWYADSSGVVRYGIGEHTKTWFMVYRGTATDKFTRIPGARLEKGDLDRVRINPGSDEGFVLSNENTGRFALHHFNFATQALGPVVYQNDTYDIDDYDLDATGTAVESVTYRDDRAHTAWMEPLLRSYQHRLEHQFPGKQVRYFSCSRDRSRFLVWIGADDDPGAYHLYVPGAGRLQSLLQVNPALQGQPLARTRYVHYPARDGLEIPAYLTLPPGREPKGLPLVILPHGGPYDVRDELDFSAEVQFLANRGYVVLQPNYRGSGGYGKPFYQRGEGQWGRAMQDDLDDGMDWLAKEGIVDPHRVCVSGSSYGGYAALWAATRNPERYRCAASYAGVSDVERQLKYQVGHLRNRYRKDWQNTVQGSGDFDLGTISPLQQVARLKVPVLVGHGEDDQRVPPKQSSLYVAALKKAGKTFEYYGYPGEGHGLYDEAHRTDWLERLDAFLAKYNPAD